MASSSTDTSPSPNSKKGEDTLTYPCLHHLESSKSIIILCALEELTELTAAATATSTTSQPPNGGGGDDDDETHNSTGTSSFKYSLKIYPRVYGPNGIEQVHVLGKSPVLTIGPNLPDDALSEARLILQYLYDTYVLLDRDHSGPDKGVEALGGGGGSLWTPSSPADRARDTFFQEFANSSLLAKVDFTLISELPSTVYPWGVRHVAGLFTWPFRWYFRKDMALFFRYMEDALGEEGEEEKLWFGGKARGMSDLMMIFPMDMADQRGYFDGTKYPKVRNWLDRTHNLPAYKRAMEKGGKYNLKTFQ